MMKRFLCAVFLVVMLVGILPAQAADPLITFYLNGDREQQRIAITIDDWYEPEMLPDFLDLAKEYDIKLTLYPIGINLKEENRDSWLRALAEGHEIGNHSNTHISFEDLSRDRVERQLNNMEKNLTQTLGQEYTVNTLRYPFGAGRHKGTRSSLAKAVADAGYIHVVLWDIDTTDPKEILRKVKNGSIILLHSNRKDLRTLKAVLPTLKERGYEMVTVSDLLGLTKTTPLPQPKVTK